MDKVPQVQQYDYIALDPKTGIITSGRSRCKSFSFQSNFDVFDTALEKGDMGHLRLLLRIYPEEQFEILSCKSEYGQTLLHRVAISSNCYEKLRVDVTELISLRLSKSANDVKQLFRNSVDDLKNTPLHYAAKYKRKMLLYWYIRKKYLDGLFDENLEGMSPFHFLVTAHSKDFLAITLRMWELTSIIEGRFNFTKFSPLHIAAKDGLIEMIQFLVEKAGFSTDECNSDPNSEDYGYFSLHYAIKYAGNSYGVFNLRVVYMDPLISYDQYDSCPNSIVRVRYFLEKSRGKSYRTENSQDSPVHIAAMYGKPNILKFLLSIDESTTCVSHVVRKDNLFRNNLLPPVAKKQFVKDFFFLPATLNKENQTCLHLIPNQSVPQLGVQCVRLILGQTCLTYSRNRDDFCLKKDAYGKTALDYAAEYEALEVCQEILVMLKCDSGSKWLRHDLLVLLYRKVPDSLIPVFEKCLRKRNVLCRREQFVTGDLAPILGERRYDDPKSVEKPETCYLHKINAIDARIRNKVLKNSLVERFIQKKFSLISNFLLAGCIFQITYIILYTVLAYISFEKCSKASMNDTQLVVSDENDVNDLHYCTELGIPEKILGVLILISAVILLIKEIYQLLRSKTWQSHFKKYANWMQLIFTMLTLSTTLSFTTANRNHLVQYNFYRILTVCGVLLGGILSLYEFKKVSKFGEFSRIFWKVAKKSALLFAYYCMLIFAFMVSFRVLTPEKGDFILPFGLVKVIAMMVGEYEFDGNFEHGGLPSDSLIMGKLIVFTLFIFVAAIVGLNLLIGLAVEDIQALKADAHTEILATQLEQIYMTEKFIIMLQPFIGQRNFLWILNKTNLIINSQHDHSRRFYFTTFEFAIPSDEGELKL